MAATIEYQGRTYHFCQLDYKEEFQKDPEKWVKLQTAAPASKEKKDEHGSAAPS